MSWLLDSLFGPWINLAMFYECFLTFLPLPCRIGNFPYWTQCLLPLYSGRSCSSSRCLAPCARSLGGCQGPRRVGRHVGSLTDSSPPSSGQHWQPGPPRCRRRPSPPRRRRSRRQVLQWASRRHRGAPVTAAACLESRRAPRSHMWPRVAYSAQRTLGRRRR